MKPLEKLLAEVYEVPLDELCHYLDEVTEFMGAEYIVDHAMPVEFKKLMLHSHRGRAAALVIALGSDMSAQRVEVLEAIADAGKKALRDLLCMPIEEVARIKESRERAEAGYQAQLAKVAAAYERGDPLGYQEVEAFVCCVCGAPKRHGHDVPRPGGEVELKSIGGPNHDPGQPEEMVLEPIYRYEQWRSACELVQGAKPHERIERGGECIHCFCSTGMVET